MYDTECEKNSLNNLSSLVIYLYITSSQGNTPFKEEQSEDCDQMILPQYFKKWFLR